MCRHVSCPPDNTACVMCKHSPKRRCTANFTSKYLQNDMLKAACGAMIKVEVVTLKDEFNTVPFEDVANYYLEVCSVGP